MRHFSASTIHYLEFRTKSLAKSDSHILLILSPQKCRLQHTAHQTHFTLWWGKTNNVQCYSNFPFNASTTNVALLISYVESSVGGLRVTSLHQYHIVSSMQIKHAQSKGKRCVCHVPMYYASTKLHYMIALIPLLMLSVHTHSRESQLAS